MREPTQIRLYTKKLSSRRLRLRNTGTVLTCRYCWTAGGEHVRWGVRQQGAARVEGGHHEEGHRGDDHWRANFSNRVSLINVVLWIRIRLDPKLFPESKISCSGCRQKRNTRQLLLTQNFIFFCFNCTEKTVKCSFNVIAVYWSFF